MGFAQPIVCLTWPFPYDEHCYLPSVLVLQEVVEAPKFHVLVISLIVFNRLFAEAREHA